MKHGKHVQLKLNNTFRTSYGTVDSKNLKSLFISISSWAEPHEDRTNWDRIIGSLKKSIKIAILNKLNSNLFKSKMVVDLDIRSSGLMMNKKSFMKCEVTLYTTKNLNIKSQELITNINELIENTIENALHSNSYFSFHPKKR